MDKKIKLKHIGVDSFFAMKNKILSDYSIAKEQTKDDAVKVEHGNVGEETIRKWLNEFLPKRFGVCKGYIITSNLEFQGKLEEWDIIIYDALESPTLFTRDSDSGSKRAIPIEYVRGVVEVKSTLTPESSNKATKKLKKLKPFFGTSNSKNYPTYLIEPFISLMMFLEIEETTFKTYKKSLINISNIYNERMIPFMGALVLKSWKNDHCSGYLRVLSGDRNDLELLENPVFELSKPFDLENGKSGLFGSISGFTKNSFPEFIFDMLEFLKGTKTNFVSSFYGLDFETPQATRLFDSK